MKLRSRLNYNINSDTAPEEDSYLITEESL